jgi:peptide deformylase
MIKAILAYGQSILRQKCDEITPNFPDLDQFIQDMWDTMYHAHGCGLAAPQIGKAIRIFVVDSKTTFENQDADERQKNFEAGDLGIQEVFINARIISCSERTWMDSEGCLSIPHISQKIARPWTINIQYMDQNFEPQTRTFGGLSARMIQHEYDHTEGILYLDYLKPLTKKLLEPKLKKITKGKLNTDYKMKFGQ